VLVGRVDNCHRLFGPVFCVLVWRALAHLFVLRAFFVVFCIFDSEELLTLTLCSENRASHTVVVREEKFEGVEPSDAVAVEEVVMHGQGCPAQGCEFEVFGLTNDDSFPPVDVGLGDSETDADLILLFNLFIDNLAGVVALLFTALSTSTGLAPFVLCFTIVCVRFHNPHVVRKQLLHNAEKNILLSLVVSELLQFFFLLRQESPAVLVEVRSLLLIQLFHLFFLHLLLPIPVLPVLPVPPASALTILLVLRLA
jgi:hypothetical protein